MAVFTDTWNSAFEAIPSDVEQLSQGASRIRSHKLAVRERLAIDHSWAGNGDDGKHKQVTFLAPLGADPAALANHGFLYTKDVAGKAELHWRDEDGNVVQVTNAGALPGFPSGTIQVFGNTTAPTGWTKLVDHDDKALRVVSGAIGNGGATAFSSVFGAGKATAAHTLTAAEMEHKHETPVQSFSLSVAAVQASNWPHGSSGTSRGGRQTNDQTQLNAQTLLSGPITSLTASGHSHNLSLDLQYVDVIRASKD